MFAFFLHSTAFQDMNIARRFIQNEEYREQMKTILRQLDKFSDDKNTKYTKYTKYTQTEEPVYMTIGTQTDFSICDDDYIDVNNLS
jgi:hypothetical protein